MRDGRLDNDTDAILSSSPGGTYPVSVSVLSEGLKQHQYQEQQGPSNMGDPVSEELQGAMDNEVPPVKRVRVEETVAVGDQDHDTWSEVSSV